MGRKSFEECAVCLRNGVQIKWKESVEVVVSLCGSDSGKMMVERGIDFSRLKKRGREYSDRVDVSSNQII